MRKMMMALEIIAVAIALVASQLPASGEPREEVLYSFSGPPDGHLPLGGLVEDTSGNLYSTLFAGGVHGAGAVPELMSTSLLTTPNRGSTLRVYLPSQH
jgi:hypothetical protein